LNNILTIEEDTEESENDFAVTMSTFEILEFEHEFALQFEHEFALQFEHEFALQVVFYQYNNILLQQLKGSKLRSQVDRLYFFLPFGPSQGHKSARLKKLLSF
jgi:hypothetical protein